MSSTADAEAERHSPLQDVWLVFSITWASAVLFHLAGNPRLAPAWGRGVLGIAAVAVLARPRDPRLAALLSIAVLVNVWLEAPLLANHWLLHGFVALVVLAGAIRSRSSGGAAMASIGGALRLVLLAFYAFAAFAKLNTDFFDPAVSCAVFYLDESASSWGIDALTAGWDDWALRSVAVVVAGIELAVPVLLLVRRTRTIGVVVGLAFHFLLAVDRSHQFFDFSSVLAALFLLFLAPETTSGLVDRLGEVRQRLATKWPSGPELLRYIGLAGAALVVVIAAGPGDWPAPDVLRNVGVAVWLVYGAGLTALVAVESRGRGPLDRLVEPSTSRILLTVPAIAAVNGLLPYLEVKSAAGWNMYANLAVVDGESNHLLVRSGVPLTDAHERLVEIVSADGIDLSFYTDGDWLLPELMLVDHISGRPDAVVRGLVDGRPVTYRGGEGDRPTWQQKFQVFRAVDAREPTRCQPGFGPAR